MAGGGNSEFKALKDVIDGMIAGMEARILELEKRLPAERPHGGGGTSGEKPASRSKGSTKKKPAGPSTGSARSKKGK